MNGRIEQRGGATAATGLLGRLVVRGGQGLALIAVCTVASASHDGDYDGDLCDSKFVRETESQGSLPYSEEYSPSTPVILEAVVVRGTFPDDHGNGGDDGWGNNAPCASRPHGVCAGHDYEFLRIVVERNDFFTAGVRIEGEREQYLSSSQEPNPETGVNDVYVVNAYTQGHSPPFRFALRTMRDYASQEVIFTVEDVDDRRGGCSCRAAPGVSMWLLVIAVVFALRRRR